MRVKDKSYRTVWMEGSTVYMIDQNLLPFEFRIFPSVNYRQTCHAISTMTVRGAGAIGATAGFAMAQAFLEAENNQDPDFLMQAKKRIEETRPTAQNLFYATKRVYEAGLLSVEKSVYEAQKIADENIEEGNLIGEYGKLLIHEGFVVLTHCNAGWLGFVDWGTALAPIYKAYWEKKKIFVYVDETRPRGQGARLTAWELHNEGVPHAIIPDNAGAYLMSLGKVDMVIVGADRIASNGDVANKIGTLEKAIVAKEYGIPFYVAAPRSTFDRKALTGSDISIEMRDQNEVIFQTGVDEKNKMTKIRVCSPGSSAFNPAFDITPAKYISGIITEKGIIKPDTESINYLFLDHYL